MPEMRASRSKTRSLARRLPVIFSTSQVVQIRKLGPTAAAEIMKRKKVEGHTKMPSRKAKGRQNSRPAFARAGMSDRLRVGRVWQPWAAFAFRAKHAARRKHSASR